MKLKEAAKKVEDSIEETLTYCDFPSEHWTRIRTNNVIETPNNLTINNLIENQTMGVSGEPHKPFGRYENVFLTEAEYDQLQAEYPDRLERFIEEMSRYLAANGRTYQNYAAALRIWAENDKKDAPKQGIPDYTCKEGESL